MANTTCGTCMMVMATIMGPLVMVLLSVSFATDYWLEMKVNRNEFTTTTRTTSQTDTLLARYTHSRHRGLFRECYPGNDTVFLENPIKIDQEVVDKHCFWSKYDIPEEVQGAGWSDEYISRIHLLRCWLAFFIMALVVFLIAYVFGLVLCCWRQSRWAYVAGLCAYIAAFSTAAAIAFFHGAEYLERNKISETDPFVGKFYIAWSDEIKNATTRKYGYSYIIGWVGMVMAALVATFYSIAGCYIGGERYEKDTPEKRSREYLERSYPVPLEPPHPEYYYGYPPARGYPTSPYVYDMDARQPLPAIGYEQPAPSTWKWQ